MSLIEFPTSARRDPGALPTAPLAPSAPGGNLHTRNVGLGHLAARLGRPEDERVATTIGFVRDLIRDKNFPEPLGFRRWKGELLRGAPAVTAASRWPAASVDAWFADNFPQHAEAAAAADERLWAERLDGAAAGLGAAA